MKSPSPMTATTSAIWLSELGTKGCRQHPPIGENEPDVMCVRG